VAVHLRPGWHIQRAFNHALPPIRALYRDLGFNVSHSRLFPFIQYSFTVSSRWLIYLTIGLAVYALIELAESAGPGCGGGDWHNGTGTHVKPVRRSKWELGGLSALAGWTQWDSGRYLIIAVHGYRHGSNIVWFSGYPAAIGAIAWIPGASPVEAGLGTTIAAGLAAAWGPDQAGHAADR
jgi:hypothetical protein